MSGKYFLDTNIFIYSFDTASQKKQDTATDLIESSLHNHTGIISTQIVQEFLNVATRKFATPLTLHDAYRYMDMVLAPLCSVYPSLTLYRSALEVQEKTAYSFYDSLIIAAALHANCKTLYSEDLQHHRSVQGLTIIDPFRA